MNKTERFWIENFLKGSFNYLWKLRPRKESLEITTPFVTINSDFVTVFLTKKDNKWIVTDGGWLDEGKYGITANQKDVAVDYFRKEYEIKTTVRKSDGRIINYLEASEERMIPTIVYNLGTFVSQAVSFIEVYNQIN